MNPWLVFWLPWISIFPAMAALLSEGTPLIHLFVAIYFLVGFTIAFGWPISVLNVLNDKLPNGEKLNIKGINRIVFILLVSSVIISSIFPNELNENGANKGWLRELAEAIFVFAIMFSFIRICYLVAKTLVKLESKESIRASSVLWTTIEIIYFQLTSYDIRRRILALDDVKFRRELYRPKPVEPFVPMKGGIDPVVRARLEAAKSRQK